MPLLGRYSNVFRLPVNSDYLRCPSEIFKVPGNGLFMVLADLFANSKSKPSRNLSRFKMQKRILRHFGIGLHEPLPEVRSESGRRCRHDSEAAATVWINEIILVKPVTVKMP